jgi:hypothetical protein
MGDPSAAPWSFSPLWFVVMAMAIPGVVWLLLAWRRALLECPNRIRRAGVKEMRRLLRSLQRSGGTPRPAHLHAWLRAAARTWDVRTSAPSVGEVSQAARALTGDANESSRWHDLWRSTEHGLYAASAQPAQDWLERASKAAASIGMPKRLSLFPNRMAHWLPSLGVALFFAMCLTPPPIDADVPLSAPTIAESAATQLSPEVQQAAQAALGRNWNDWAAHRNLAAFEIQEGELNLAIAHATAAFVQHPAASTTRDALLAALGETQAVDANLRRLLSGTWYERAPTLLSPAEWQRVALVAGLIVASGLSVMVLSLYAPSGPRPLVWAGRGACAAGILLLIAAMGSWNAYGALSQPAAAILVQGANVSPVPTDLVPEEETSPLAAGAVVLSHRTFLSWREISSGPDTSGWIRSGALMPLYASPILTDT